MKIVVTGSLGHISKPLAVTLIANGHNVTVISSQAQRRSEIEALGATAAIGQLYDVDFLAEYFKNADIVYLMQPPGLYFQKEPDHRMVWTHLATGYAEAIRQSQVTKVVHLSSIGAHTDIGVGILGSHHKVENILKGLPESVSIKFMRPVGFYYNMFSFIPSIKTSKAIFQNYGGDQKEPWVSPLDIAAAIAEEMETPFAGRTVRYIASDEVSPNELARIIGEAIGMPELEWKVLSNDQFRENLLSVGMSSGIADGFTEMNAARVTNLYDDYNNHKPVLGKIKVRDFASEFAVVYRQS